MLILNLFSFRFDIVYSNENILKINITQHRDFFIIQHTDIKFKI